MTRNLFLVLVCVYVAIGQQCKLCASERPCCLITFVNNAGSCTMNGIDYLLQVSPGRPFWLNANNKAANAALSVSFPPLNERGHTEQLVKAHAFFIFTDDVTFIDDGARSLLCSRRWGCIPCISTPAFTECSTGGWVNATITRSKDCSGRPELNVVWWGEDLNHGAGVMDVCLSYLPDQVQPQPPVPANNKTYGVGWMLDLAADQNAGDWPATIYDIDCYAMDVPNPASTKGLPRPLF